MRELLASQDILEASTCFGDLTDETLVCGDTHWTLASEDDDRDDLNSTMIMMEMVKVIE